MACCLAWVLARYQFPGKRLLDALVDVPFALPTAVAGLALTALFSKTGWFGGPLDAIGISVAYTPLGIAIAMAFTSIPFVVRTVQPVIEDLGTDVEEASRSLGANDLQILTKIILPSIFPALLAGCFAVVRAQPRRIRRGDLHRRQPADAHRDRRAADLHPARGIRLPGRRRDRGGDAGDGLHHAGRSPTRCRPGNCAISDAAGCDDQASASAEEGLDGDAGRRRPGGAARGARHRGRGHAGLPGGAAGADRVVGVCARRRRVLSAISATPARCMRCGSPPSPR